MTSRSPHTLLALAVASLTLGMTPLGCGGDGPAKGGQGGTAGVVLPALGGRGGSSAGGSAGANVTGGSGAGGSAGSGGAATAGGAGGGTAGAGGATAGGAAGQDAAAGGAGGMAGAGGAQVDAPVVVDTAPPVDLAPDLPPATTTVDVTTCSQILCPRLVAATSACVASETTCTHQVTMADPQKHTSYCHSNGVKKFAKTTYAASGTGYTTIMEVLQNGGGACYTLEIRGTAEGAADVQSWTYKNAGGETVGTAVWRASDESLTVTCDGVNYRIGDVGCPGTDGQPNDEGGDCNAGSCTR